MNMDINQIIELWRGLSPHLARTIPGQELAKDKYAHEKNSAEDSEDKTVDPPVNHREENDV
jgi:hypothetical protein